MKSLPLLFSLAVFAADDSFVLRNVTIHPVTAASIPNATLVVTGGKIADFGPKAAVPRGARVIDGKGLHVYPGLIDSASNVGMSEVGSVRESVDIVELGDFNPQIRAIVAVNPSSDHIPVTRASGITSSLLFPGGGIIGGQAALVHLDGWTWEEMAIEKNVAMQMRMPTLAATTYTPAFGAGRRTFAETKRRYDERVKLISTFFEQARAYQKRKAAGGMAFAVDRRLEAILPVLEGRQSLMIFAAREPAVRDALAFAARENVKIVLAGVREAGQSVKDIAAQKVPVILGETLDLPLEEDSPYDSPFTLPGELHKAGVTFAFGSFSVQFARNLPFQAANAVGFGLPYEEALKAVTINAARIWGVADRIGSIEKGKWADLILTNGDPLEARSQVKQMWIQGRPVSLETRHTKLYEQYGKRP
ncbi:MAG TPA: amidohydrolase family protein [Bryobacteraceae bacterium]|nr:amidohydrolase family protein [Bryobacteraceae bacterium]